MLKFTVVSLTSLFLLVGCNTAPPAPTTPAIDIAAEQGKIRDLETAWAKDAAASAILIRRLKASDRHHPTEHQSERHRCESDRRRPGELPKSLSMAG